MVHEELQYRNSYIKTFNGVILIVNIELDSFQVLTYQLSRMVTVCPLSELGLLRTFDNFAINLFRIKFETDLHGALWRLPQAALLH